MANSNPEAPVKNYQLVPITDGVVRIEALVNKLNDKIDTKLVTNEQMEMALKLVRKDYDPMKRNLYRITWTVIGVIIPLVVLSVMQLISNVGTK